MLTIDYARCSGCRRCEVHCSFSHSGRTGHAGSRIRVEKIEKIGIDFPVVCQECREHYCTRCPQHAISITDRGSIEVSPTLCNLCGACEKLCPVGAIEIYNGIPQVCDLCGGAPRCVEACAMGVITYSPDVRRQVSLARFKAAGRKMTPGQKRFAYANALGEAVRDGWLNKRSA